MNCEVRPQYLVHTGNTGKVQMAESYWVFGNMYLFLVFSHFYLHLLFGQRCFIGTFAYMHTVQRNQIHLWLTEFTPFHPPQLVCAPKDNLCYTGFGKYLCLYRQTSLLALVSLLIIIGSWCVFLWILYE
jgi:hypothetical protein